MKRGHHPLPLRTRLLARLDVRGPDECWNWMGFVEKVGYGVLKDEGGYGNIKAHRASWVVHRGPIPEGMHVLHGCDNRRCCNPAHLRLGTHQENMHDRKERGRTHITASEDVANAKLTSRKAFEIRLLAARGWKDAWIARDFGMAHTSVTAVRKGETWRATFERDSEALGHPREKLMAGAQALSRSAPA